MKLKVQNTSEKFCKIHPFLYWTIVPFLCTRRPGTDSARRQGILRIDLGARSDSPMNIELNPLILAWNSRRGSIQTIDFQERSDAEFARRAHLHTSPAGAAVLEMLYPQQFVSVDLRIY